MATLERITEELSKVGRVYAEARDQLYMLEGRHLRHVMLAYAEQHPEVEKFSYSVTSEYDDEGGYYDSATLYRLPEDVDDEPMYEITDYGYDKEAFSAAFGNYDDREATATIAELRALEQAAPSLDPPVTVSV